MKALALVALALALSPGHARAEPPQGRRLALVVGTSAYASEAWATLPNAVADANAVADLLESRYGYAVTRLVDPSRDAFKRALAQASATAGDADDLVVFVAGHGHFDTTDRAGYLAFSDATDACGQGCYPYDNVKRALYGTRARHVLVMIDACYAGTFDLAVAFGSHARPRGDTAATRRLFDEYARARSRLILASVGRAPTLDGTPGMAHTPFVRVLLAELGRSGAAGVVSVDHLALRMREGPEPVPIIAPTTFPAALPHDVNGTFLFIAEGDFCTALAELAAELARQPTGGWEAASWGASGPVDTRLPGASACLRQRFETDATELLRCRFGTWPEAQIEEQRRTLDKRLALCGVAGVRSRSAVACDEGSCALTAVIE